MWCHNVDVNVIFNTDLAIGNWHYHCQPSIYRIVSICISFDVRFLPFRKIYAIRTPCVRCTYNWNPVDMLPMAYYYIKWCDQIVISNEMAEGATEEEKTGNKGSILKICVWVLFEKLSPHFNCVHLKSVFSFFFSLVRLLCCAPHENVSQILATKYRIKSSIQRREKKWK